MAASRHVRKTRKQCKVSPSISSVSPYGSVFFDVNFDGAGQALINNAMLAMRARIEMSNGITLTDRDLAARCRIREFSGISSLYLNVSGILHDGNTQPCSMKSLHCQNRIDRSPASAFHGTNCLYRLMRCSCITRDAKELLYKGDSL